eukprot:COSAG02_NODE_993_length_15368_cov_4.680005_14_plen_82_part_00
METDILYFCFSAVVFVGLWLCVFCVVYMGARSSDVYVSRLDAVLSRKVGVIQTLQAKLSDFRSHLQEEEHLNQSRSSLSFK